MNAGSLLEIYAITLGWSNYGLISDWFWATGLVIVPFILTLILLQNWRRLVGFYDIKAGWALSTFRRAYRQRAAALITATAAALVLIHGYRVIL